MQLFVKHNCCLSILCIVVSCMLLVPTKTSTIHQINPNCPGGFMIEPLTGICTDENECNALSPPCQHHCLNTNGSYMCFCYPGFSLNTDKHTCSIHNTNTSLLASSGNKIYALDYNATTESWQEPQLLMETYGQILSFAVDIENDEIYYMEAISNKNDSDGVWAYNTLTQTRTRKSNPHTKIRSNAVLALNWLDGYIYLAIDQRILRARKSDKILAFDSQFYVAPPNQRISDVTVDPVKRLLYVTERGAQSKLKILNLDTKQTLHEFSTTTNYLINSQLKVSVNVFENSVYLVNGGDSSIDQCTLTRDALSCSTLLAGGPNITSHVFHLGDKLYYVKSEDILSDCGMRDCAVSQEVRQLPFTPSRIIIWNKEQQSRPTQELCSKCEHACEIIDSWYAMCFCNAGFSLDDDTTSCIDMDECEDHDHQPCEDTCHNTIGGFYCTCEQPIHRINKDGRTCEPFSHSCQEGLCSHGCSTTMDGLHAICTCPVGSHPMDDKLNCTGCRAGDNGGCSHLCIETGVDSFTCGCPSGYYLDKSGNNCVLDANSLQLLIVTDKAIKLFSRGNMQLLRSVSVPGVRDITLDHTNRVAYFISASQKRIGKLDLNDFTDTTLVSIDGYQLLSLAIDWSYDKLYMSDNETGAIYQMLINTNTRDRHYGLTSVVEPGEVKNPRELTIDSDTGQLYFICDSKYNNATVDLMMLNLFNHDLATTLGNLSDARSLTIDYQDEKLYLINVVEEQIESLSIKEEVSTRRLQVANTRIEASLIQSLDVHFYIVESQKRWKLVLHDKISGKKIENLSRGKRVEIGDISKLKVLHETSAINVKRDTFGPCARLNGGCEHKCTLDNLGLVKCSCFANYTQDASDLSRCIPQSHMRIVPDNWNPSGNKDWSISASCQKNGRECHRDAECIKKASGELRCECKKEFLGDGYSICESKESICTTEEAQEADCGRHGQCRKNKAIGDSFMLSCRCEVYWGGINCLEFAGRRLTAKSDKTVVHTHSTKTKLQLLGMVFCAGATVTVLLGWLLWRKGRKRVRESSHGYRHPIPLTTQHAEIECESQSEANERFSLQSQTKKTQNATADSEISEMFPR